MTRFRLAASCGALFAALLCASTTGPLTASAVTIPEVDSAVLTFNGAGYDCTFTGSDDSVGTCSVTNVALGASCLGLPQLQRPGAVSLVEPSGESVTLDVTVIGTAGDGTFAGTGTDGSSAATGGGAYGVTCHGIQTAGIDVSLSWAVA
jgi:hypothetical protein